MLPTILPLFLAGLCAASPSLPKRGLPSNCVYVNKVGFGVLPSDGSATSPKYTMTKLNTDLGAKICGYGWYAQVTGSSFSGSQLTQVLNDVVSSGAVFQPAVMPTLQLGSFTASTAADVAKVLKQFTDKGVEVWLRFGHEMNWYLSDGTYHGTAAQFVNAWKLMSAAVKSNPLIKMWWSPNVNGQGVQSIAQYWPGPSYVDLVGIDCYPKDSTISSSSFDNCYKSFYNTYSAPFSKPFAIGETGYCGSSGPDSWLSAIMNPPSGYPNYIAASWFEYNKECDFRVIENGNLAKTKQILLNGGGSGSGYPPDTCNWGCEGWSCSSSSPCQSAYTCVGGTCSNCSWGCGGWACSASQPCNADYTCVSGTCHHSGPAS